ncbi:MAG: LysR family transcriptional regulator [Polaromonas sp.]|nr:LysR family transcriptional regulator [Polaromonas sp.]
MLRLGIHHLETLFWISRLGTFTAAAERLNTTQSAVSGRIRELESRLNTRLFYREGRRMVLTVHGREIVKGCEPLLNEMERLLLLASGGDAFSGTVRVGSGEAAALLCLPRMLSALTRDMPLVSWDIDVDLTISLRQKLDSGLLDLALLVGPIDGHLLKAHPIGKVGLTWMASRHFLETLDDPTTLFARNAAPIWSLSKPSYQYQLTVDVMRKYGGNPQRINTCRNVRTLIDLVLSGAGAAMVPESLVLKEIESTKLIPLRDIGIGVDEIIEFFVVMRRLEGDPLIKEVFTRASAYTLDRA